MALAVADTPKLCSNAPGPHLEPEQSALLLPDDVLASILSLLPQRQRCGSFVRSNEDRSFLFSDPHSATSRQAALPSPPAACRRCALAWPPSAMSSSHKCVLRARVQGPGRTGVSTLGSCIVHRGLAVGVFGAVADAARPAHTGACRKPLWLLRLPLLAPCCTQMTAGARLTTAVRFCELPCTVMTADVMTAGARSFYGCASQ